MERRLFGMGFLALSIAACDSSSKSSSKKKKDDDDDDDDEKPRKKSKDKGKGEPTAKTGDPLVGWVTGTLGDVSAKFPKAPESKNQEATGVKIAILLAESSNDDNFMLMTGDYSVDVDETTALTNFKTSAFKSMKDKTLTFKDITLNGMKGVESRATTPTATQGVQRAYYDAKKKRTVIMTTVSNKKWDEQVATAFLNSLAIK